MLKGVLLDRIACRLTLPVDLLESGANSAPLEACQNLRARRARVDHLICIDGEQDTSAARRRNGSASASALAAVRSKSQATVMRLRTTGLVPDFVSVARRTARSVGGRVSGGADHRAAGAEARGSLDESRKRTMIALDSRDDITARLEGRAGEGCLPVSAFLGRALCYRRALTSVVAHDSPLRDDGTSILRPTARAVFGRCTPRRSAPSLAVVAVRVRSQAIAVIPEFRLPAGSARPQRNHSRSLLKWTTTGLALQLRSAS